MGNKSILMSIQPQWVAKILNGEKTIEVRKKFPKDYVGWVYIYCTKKYKITQANNGEYVTEYGKNYRINSRFSIHGYVVARFWCDKASVINFNSCPMIPTIAYTTFLDRYYSDTDLQRASCLNGNELMWYLGTDKKEVGYAIHISKLEVFDNCWALTYFRKYGYEEEREKYAISGKPHKSLLDWLREWSVKRPPQNYCYVEPNWSGYDNKTL